MTDVEAALPGPMLPVVPRANDVYAGMRLLYDYGFETVFLERRRFR